MTIQEAIKSGKPFIRSCYNFWYVIEDADKKCTYDSSFIPFFNADCDDILSTNWRVLLCKEHDISTIDSEITSCIYCDNEEGKKLDKKCEILKEVLNNSTIIEELSKVIIKKLSESENDI